MNIPYARRTVLSAAFSLSLLGTLPAQWATLPYNPLQPLVTENWFVAHATPSGIQAFSAIAQAWNTVSPATATIVHSGDSVLVTEESGSVLRGWSAFTNTSAAQTFSTSHGSLVGTHQGTSYGIAIDNVPATNGILRAYSSFTNTWSSLARPSVPNTALRWSSNVAVQQEGLNYHAYSAYTGQWVTFSVPVAGGAPFVGPDFAAVDLRGTVGPFQYAAFSAVRGVWTLSPTYPSTGAGLASAPGAAAFAIQVPDVTPGLFRYCGYSPYTAQWTTSGGRHVAGSTPTATARGNLVRVLDTNQVEVFGAPNGIWKVLTGSSLVEVGMFDDFDVVSQVNGASTTLYFATGLVPGGWPALPVTGTGSNVQVIGGAHGALVCGGVDLLTSQAWGYSALTGTLTVPASFPMAGGYAVAGSGFVFGTNVQGGLSAGTVARAYSARWGTWVDGPAIGSSPIWQVVAGESTLLLLNSTILGSTISVFDEHSNHWLPSVTNASYKIGANAVLSYTPGAGVMQAYSAQRGDWQQQGGIGAITSNGGQPQILGNLVWFTDATRLYVFPTPDVAQCWWQFPAGQKFAVSGQTAGGATPCLSVSMRGRPNSDFALLYANLTLGPAPVAIPGFAGLLDLSFLGMFQLAVPGIVGSSGVVQVRLPLPTALPKGLQVWIQGVTVDLATFQMTIAGRAASAQFL